MRLLLFLLLLLPAAARAAMLPGFRVETVARADGFVSSLVVDSKGTVYFTTTDGWIQRIDGGQATKIAALPTRAGGNGGLLGMALAGDDTAVVHYTTWSAHDFVLDDVIARVDLATGAETVVHAFVCDIEKRDRGVSSEHHGGNPTVAEDGSIFVAIGDYNGRTIAQKPEWNGGKIFRIDPAGEVSQWAIGVRNPYDLVWDPGLQLLVFTDNGPDAGDELNAVAAGSNCGWPRTFGNEPPLEGAVAPQYVFPGTVAPTGLARLDGASALLPRGYLLGAFVTRAIYYVPDIEQRPAPDPIAILENFDEFVIDVTQAPSGEVYFATASFPGSTAIHRLHIPLRGDCNGDGLADWRDFLPLMSELQDGNPQQTVHVQDGEHSGTWGCDVNADSAVDESDLVELTRRLIKKRAVRHR
jgi:glucose/arabinose dehydrogenase